MIRLASMAGLLPPGLSSSVMCSQQGGSRWTAGLMRLRMELCTTNSLHYLVDIEKVGSSKVEER